jgi:CheY-like chemotaxis protein
LKHLLIVEDAPLDVAIIEEFLGQGRYRLSFAADGVDAWERLMQDPEGFDTVILDRVMPRLDGLELLARIVSDPRLSTLPVIMQTAADTPEEVAEGLAAGAWYYLGKPYKALSLQRVVAGAVADRDNRVQLRRLQSELEETWTLIREGRFRFRTPAHAQLLAARLGALCPHPSQAALGLFELMINAVEHGNLRIGYRDKSLLLEHDDLTLEIERRLAAPQQQDVWAEIGFRYAADRIEFRIEDRGPGFDWRGFLDIAPERVFDSHGRGIAMARKLAFDSLEYEGVGNVVRVSLDLTSEAASGRSPS